MTSFADRSLMPNFDANPTAGEPTAEPKLRLTGTANADADPKEIANQIASDVKQNRLSAVHAGREFVQATASMTREQKLATFGKLIDELF